MNKCSALTLLACAFGLLTAERVEAAPVIWDFIATSCSEIPNADSLCDPAQRYPLVLAELTLDGPDSSGRASSDPHFPATGDPFAFDLVAAHCPGCVNSHVSTADPTGPIISPPGVVPPDYWVVDYSIAWTEVAGQLTTVDIIFFTIHDDLSNFGLTGGEVGSDGDLAGCEASTCQINGYWVNDALVTAPEPGSLALLASAFGVWGLAGRRTKRNGRNLIRLAMPDWIFPGAARGARGN